MSWRRSALCRVAEIVMECSWSEYVIGDNLSRFRWIPELEIADRVAAVREKRDLLVQLKALRLQDLIQAPLRFGVHGLHKAKTLAGGRLLVLVASEGQGTFADNDLEVPFLLVPVPHVAAVNAHRDGAIGDG